MASKPIFDLTQFDFEKPLYSIEQIREINPQRYEMEHLTAIVHLCDETRSAVGYKNIAPDEFWVRGHMPGYPMMPGVIQCEAAAQLAGFYARKTKLIGGDYLGFGGINRVRFRKPVVPGDRLDLIAQVTRVAGKRLAEFTIQGFVDGRMAFDGEMIGVAISKDG